MVVGGDFEIRHEVVVVHECVGQDHLVFHRDDLDRQDIAYLEFIRGFKHMFLLFGLNHSFTVKALYHIWYLNPRYLMMVCGDEVSLEGIAHRPQ